MAVSLKIPVILSISALQEVGESATICASLARFFVPVWLGFGPFAMHLAREFAEGPLLVSGSSVINGSVLNDAIVQRNGFLHIHGNLKGSLTIEPGANVVVEGSVDGKVINRGGRLVVNNKGIAEFARVEGPAEPEAGGVLKVNLAASGN